MSGRTNRTLSGQKKFVRILIGQEIVCPAGQLFAHLCSPPTYEEDTYCYFQPINSPKSNERSDICSLNGSTTCFEAIYDQTKNVFAYAKSNQPTLANHSQLDLNRTDLYPQTLLNCNSVEFEGMLNHLYSL